MARPVLQIVGTAVGFAFGGPIGAAIGGAIGGAVGGMIEGPQQFEGPRLTDLRVSSSTYGQPIPIIYGPENRSSGNMIWTSGLIEKKSKKKSGGKGGGGSETTEYSYSAHVAISIGEGARLPSGLGMRNIKAIWANGKRIWGGEIFQQIVDKAQADYDKADARADNLEAQAAACGLGFYCQLIHAMAAAARSTANRKLAELQEAQAALASYEAGFSAWGLSSPLMSGISVLRYYPGNFTQVPDPTIESALGAGNTPAYRGTAYVVLTGLQLADFGNSIPNLEFEIDGQQTYSVAGILRDISERAGLAQNEYSIGGQLAQSAINGYAISRQSEALAAIRPLEIAYSFDTAEQGGQIRFVNRGRMALASIEHTDMAARERRDGAEPETPLTTERLPDVQLPKLATLTYRDKERDYQENTQRSIRDRGEVQHKVDESLAMTLSDGEARRIVDRMLWESWVGRMLAKFKVTDKFAFLRPGDVVTVRVAGVMTPFRVEQFTRGFDGTIECSARMEDPFIYNGSTAGAAATVPANEVQFVGDTLAYAYNAPIIYTTESDTAFSWAMDGESSGWRGGQIFRSLDGLDFTSMASSKFRNTTGIVAGVLGAASADFWDRESVITVTLTHPEHELESFPEDQVLNGLNAFWLGRPDGSRGEVIQFATATLISANPKVYELSNLLRGRRATEHEVGAHVANEVFVYFELGLMQTADFGLPDWDKLRYYKGVSIYQSVDDVVDVQEFINTGEKARPRSPVLATGERDSSNNLTINWVRRMRGLAPSFGDGPVPMDEQTEAYEIDIMSGITVVRTISASVTSASYTAAEQTADGLTPGNPVTMRIYQMSATRGRGHAGEFTL